jgi:hypothetical protein
MPPAHENVPAATVAPEIELMSIPWSKVAVVEFADVHEMLKGAPATMVSGVLISVQVGPVCAEANVAEANESSATARTTARCWKETVIITVISGYRINKKNLETNVT